MLNHAWADEEESELPGLDEMDEMSWSDEGIGSRRVRELLGVKNMGLDTCGVVWELNRAQKRVLRKKLPLQQSADGFPSLDVEPKPQSDICVH